MILIEPQKPVVWRQGEGFEGMCEHIARCAAVCYNSTPKKGGEAVEFVKMLIRRGHGRPLEFGTISAKAPNEGNEIIKGMIATLGMSYGRWGADHEKGETFATFNLRQLVEMGMEFGQIEKMLDASEKQGGADFFPRVTIFYPALSRAIADEFRTHTTLSTLMQSTRYVNAAKGADKKLKEIELIKPFWLDTTDNETGETAKNLLEMVERFYQGATAEKGLKPQEARDLLPLCIKTRMVQCGFLDSWRNFLQLRTAKEAHPDARRTAREVYAALIEDQTRLGFKLDSGNEQR